MEEELRKEQAEMHKLLKAKQDLIEIQKKRIEYLTHRSSAPQQLLQQLQSTTAAAATTTPSSVISAALPSTNIHRHISQQNPASSSANPSSTNNYNQHAHQPKVRQLNRTQIKTSITPSASNPNLNTAAEYTHMRNSNANLDADSSAAPQKAGVTQIAASPSSSSASMTQFCSYLAANSLKGSTSNLTLDQIQKSKSKSGSNAATSNGGGNGASSSLAVDHSSSSTSSSSSSSSSSAISMHHQNPLLTESLYTPHMHQAGVNFLRTSEL